MPAFQSRDIQGLTPAVEPTQSEKLFVLSGRNYLFDSKGPYSAFGDRFLSHQPFREPVGSQGHRIKLATGDQSYYFTPDAVYDWQESSRDFRSLYRFTPLIYAQEAWNLEYINGKVFMNHPSIGILVHELGIEGMYPAESAGIGVPHSVQAIASHESRLIAVTLDAFHYSARSNGLDFEPRLGNGGFQLIRDLVPGRPIAVTSFDYGCVTWTTGGAIRSEFRGDAAVYRHSAIETQYRPVNSHCVARVSDTQVVILDRHGLYATDGGTITPYSPIFNEFFGEYVRENRINLNDYARLYWDEIRQLLFVSISLDEYEATYDKSFVYYPPMDKWGEFNKPHFSILPVDIPTGSRQGSYSGYMDIQGRARYFSEGYSAQAHPESEDSDYDQLDFVRSNLQLPIYYSQESGATVASSSKPAQVELPLDRPTGYFHPEGVSPQVGGLTGLDSALKIGFFRLARGESDDELTEITDLMIRSVTRDHGDGPSARVDPTESRSQDFDEFVVDSSIPRVDPTKYLDTKIKVAGSVDGESEFDYVNPHLVNESPHARYYSLSCVGMWHSVEFFADYVGEAFQPGLIQMTAISAGRLT